MSVDTREVTPVTPTTAEALRTAILELLIPFRPAGESTFKIKGEYDEVRIHLDGEDELSIYDGEEFWYIQRERGTWVLRQQPNGINALKRDGRMDAAVTDYEDKYDWMVRQVEIHTAQLEEQEAALTSETHEELAKVLEE